MIIPVVCFSCGKPLGHLWNKYKTTVKHYEDTKDTKDGDEAPEFLALRDLKLFRTCCRRMFICQHDMYDKISGPSGQSGALLD